MTRPSWHKTAFGYDWVGPGAAIQVFENDDHWNWQVDCTLDGADTTATRAGFQTPQAAMSSAKSWLRRQGCTPTRPQEDA